MLSTKKLLTERQYLQDRQLDDLTKNEDLDSSSLKDEVFFPATSCPISPNLQGGILVEFTEDDRLNSVPKAMSLIEEEDSDIPADTKTNSESSEKKVIFSLVVRAILLILSCFQLYCPLEVTQPNSNRVKFATVIPRRKLDRAKSARIREFVNEDSEILKFKKAIANGKS